MNSSFPNSIIPQSSPDGKSGNGRSRIQVGSGEPPQPLTAAVATTQFIQELFSGQEFDPNLDMGQFGEFAKVVESLLEARKDGGLPTALKARDALVRVNPGLASILGVKTPQELHPWSNQLFSLEDALKPRPPLKYVVEGLFPCPSLNIVYGAPGSLKSMLILDMAMCVSSGLPWLGSRPGDKHPVEAIATTQVPVLYIDFDNGPRKMHERIGALARGHNIKRELPISYFSMPNPWLNASSPEEVEALGQFAKEEGFATHHHRQPEHHLREGR